MKTYGLLVRAIILMVALIMNALVVAITVILMASVARMCRGQWYRLWMRGAHRVTVWWMQGNRCILWGVGRHRWAVEGVSDFSPQKNYVLISNHQSWLDILVLGVVFTGRAPILKFFMKKELLWMLPFAGLASYLLGYPFMARHSREDIRRNPELKGQDLATAKAACQKFREFPTTVMNFVEGTRVTPKKQLQSQSPYHHLLKPKSAGIAVVLHELETALSGIIDVTIHYAERPMTLWRFLKGECTRITCHYEVLPVTADLMGDYHQNRAFRATFQQWLNTRWVHKDEWLEQVESRERV